MIRLHKLSFELSAIDNNKIINQHRVLIKILIKQIVNGTAEEVFNNDK